MTNAPKRLTCCHAVLDHFMWLYMVVKWTSLQFYNSIALPTKFHTVICGSATSSCHVGSWGAAVMWCLLQQKVVAVYNQHTKGFSTTWFSQRVPSLGKTTMFFQVFVCMAEISSNGTMQHLAGLTETTELVNLWLVAEWLFSKCQLRQRIPSFHSKATVVQVMWCTLQFTLKFASHWQASQPLVWELGPMWNPGDQDNGWYIWFVFLKAHPFCVVLPFQLDSTMGFSLMRMVLCKAQVCIGHEGAFRVFKGWKSREWVSVQWVSHIFASNQIDFHPEHLVETFTASIDAAFSLLKNTHIRRAYTDLRQPCW